MTKAALRVDWATLEAARFACERWHYSGSIPMPPLVRIGVWEEGRFIGVVLFSRGASPHLLSRYGLQQHEGCELTRVALTTHKSQVSRVVALAIKFLRRHAPGLRLIVSFADPNAGHHGGIYQAGGWLYCGTSAGKVDWIGPDGKFYLNRQTSVSGLVRQFGKVTKVFKRAECTPVEMAPKHRYLMPLDADMRASVLPLAQPYPKRTMSPARAKDQAAEHPSALGGETPTRTLQTQDRPVATGTETTP